MNPFSRGRYEHIPTHLYYLPTGLIEKLEDSKPSYVIGSRGSGKTTLLKALSWDERLENKWLNRELGGDSFRGRFVGTYTKAPLVQVPAFQEWLRNTSDVQHAALFGHYFDLIAAENLAYSLGRIISSLQFDVSPDAERQALSEFGYENEFLDGELGRPKIESVMDCHAALRRRRRQLESFAVAEKPVQEVLETTTLPVAGNVARSLGGCLAALLDESTQADHTNRWHFKCCFDEAECLDQRQLVVLNTIVRNSNWPVSYVISFVGQPDDLSLTIHQSLTVQKSDRSVIHLDSLSRPEFEQLCDGVGNIRIKALLEGQNDEWMFRTRDVLGTLDLNLLVSDMVKKSESKFAKQLETEAQTFRSSPWVEKLRAEAPAPYVEAYLANRLNIEPPDPSVQGAQREQASREFRKKFVASYLSICREIGVKKTPYAFSHMVLGISDTCVRDYLSQMHRIFEQSKRSLQDFLQSTVPVEIQINAIHSTSVEKRDSIMSGEEITNPERVRRITTVLGEITAILQRGWSRTDNHLRSSERGLFHFGNSISPDGVDEQIYNTLKDASDAGFLRVKRNRKMIDTFRVHASMAPAFGFSYRGAYYPVQIKKQDVFDALDCDKDEELSKMARKVADRILGSKEDPNQLTLFSFDDDEGTRSDDYF